MEAGYFALSVKPLDKLDFCQFSATNAVLILLMSWISSPPSVRFRLCRNSNPSILSSTGLKLGSSRGKFTRTPATRNTVQSHKIGHSRQFIALNPCSITKNSVSLHRLAGRRCPFPRRFWATRTDHWGPSVRKVHSLALLSHFAGGQEFVCGDFEETPQRRCQCRFEMQYRYPIFAYDRTL